MNNDYLIPGSTLSGIADAIREKGGTTDVIATEDMAAAIAAIKAGGGNVQYFTLPKGRMRGDLNGDGSINGADFKILRSYVITKPTDEMLLWCADINDNGSVNSLDLSPLEAYITTGGGVLASRPTMADYYRNWNYIKVSDTEGYFYRDVAIDSTLEMSNAKLMVSAYPEIFMQPVYGDNTIRISVTACPPDDVACCLVELDGEANYTSAPVHIPQAAGTTPVRVENNSSKSVYYFSINYPSWIEVPTGESVVDGLLPTQPYMVTWDNTTIRRTVDVGGTDFETIASVTANSVYLGDPKIDADCVAGFVMSPVIAEASIVFADG